MKLIKTWQKRMERFTWDDMQFMGEETFIKSSMQAEIDELRAYVEELEQALETEYQRQAGESI